MKRIVLITILCFSVSFIMNAQIDIKSKLKDKTNKRANKRTDQGIDKGLDAAEEGIKNLFTGNKDEKKEENKEEETAKKDAENTSAEKDVDSKDTKSDPTLTWAKYDFVPGDKVIFEDNQENEENGEFPSRWDLVTGTTEIANFGGDNVIMFRGGAPTIIPYLKNSDKDYLPDVFTVEFDLFVNSGSFDIYLYDRKNQKHSSNSQYNIELWGSSMRCASAESKIPDKGSIYGRWAHIAIAYTNGKLKGYIDDTRLINIPHLEINPTGISLHAYHAKDENRYYLKNFRIAEGGVKYYDRVLQDGKIIANGIRFDVNKATLKPESMGVINGIYDLLKNNPDLKFSIEGHTDSDGDNDFNQKLSEERAKAVREKLIAMGIDKDRLTSKGFGESKPIDSNDTAEGKANNRRVEFVKI